MMNETYWVVIWPRERPLWLRLARYRRDAIRYFIMDVFLMPYIAANDARQEWRKLYRRGARCKKVRLVLED